MKKLISAFIILASLLSTHSAYALTRAQELRLDRFVRKFETRLIKLPTLEQARARINVHNNINRYLRRSSNPQVREVLRYLQTNIPVSSIEYRPANSVPKVQSLEEARTEAQKETNAIRKNAGVNALIYSDTLNQIAQEYAETLESHKHFSHTGPDGSTISTRLAEWGYNYLAAGENIGQGQNTAVQVIGAFFNSPPHKANLVNEAYTQMGIGKSGTYWVALYGTPQQ